VVISYGGADKVPVSKEQEKSRRGYYTEKWKKKVQNLKGKIQVKKGFIEKQNNIQKTALAKGEKMKYADLLWHNLRAAELPRMTVERESKDLNNLQEQLARHFDKKPKKTPGWPDQLILMLLM